MRDEARKLHIIEEILKIEDDNILTEMETVIAKTRMHRAERKSFQNLQG